MSKKRNRRSSSSTSSLEGNAISISSTSTSSNPNSNSISLLAGGSYGRAASAFTETAYHGQLVCCGCGHVIKIMSIKTGQVLHTLRGHTQVVTGLAVSPRRALRLFSSSMDGTVIVWDISDGSILERHELVNGVPILDISLPAADNDLIYVVAEVKTSSGSRDSTSSTSTSSTTRKAYSYNVKSKKVERMVMKGLKGGGTMEVAFRQISRGNVVETSSSGSSNTNTNDNSNKKNNKKKKNNKNKNKTNNDSQNENSSNVVSLEPGVTVVAGISKTTLKIWNSTTSKARKFTHEHKLTAVALHPTAPHAVTGDAGGRIQLWYNVAQPANKSNKASSTTTTSLHWHAHRVHALCFTPDGHYLLSGGEEAVLVIWQLRTLKQQFLPRLGSTIVAISVSTDGLHYVVGTDDNVIHVIDAATLKETWTSVGIASAVSETTTQYSNFKRSKYMYTGMTMDPRTRCFMLNSTLGSGKLQLYDYRRDRHVQFVNVAPRNVVSRVEKKRMQPTVIERIAFSNDGLDMVTIDRRLGESGFDDVTSLKFWEYDISLNEYVLNTRVRTPHSKMITSLSFAESPSRGKIVVTASQDHKFKIWRPTTMKIGPTTTRRAEATNSRTNNSVAAARVVWDCYSVGFYRDKPIHDAAMSDDGSILAVAYDNIVTLWSPLDNMLQHTLPHPSSLKGDCVKTVSFVGDSPLLVTTTEKDMYVWNLLTCNVLWELHGIHPFRVCCTGGLENDNWREGARIAVVTSHPSSPSVLLFDALKPTPIFRWSLPSGVRPTGIWFEEGSLKKNFSASSSSTSSASSSSSTSSIASSIASPTLLLVTEHVQMYRLRPTLDTTQAMTLTENTSSSSQQQQLSNFQKMFGTRSNTTNPSDASRNQFNTQFSTDNDTILVDGPSHVVASVASLFDTFMRQSGGEDAVIPSRTSTNAVLSTIANETVAMQEEQPFTAVVASTNVSFSTAQQSVVSAESVPVRFDAASEEMLMEWFSKDGQAEVVIPSSSKSKGSKGSKGSKASKAAKKAPTSGPPKSSTKKKRAGTAAGSVRKSKRTKS